MDWAFYADRVFPTLNNGFWLTIQLIIPSAVLGFALGVALGVLRVFGHPTLRRIGDIYTAIFRGVPLLVQLYILYYALPKVGLYFDGFTAAVIGFILCSGAYHSEYIRGALLSIRQGQLKAAQALGFSTFQMVRSILIPQAMRRALPGCGNEFIYLIKYTSLAYVTTVDELTAIAKGLGTVTLRYTEIFMIVGFYYLMLTSLAAWLLHRIEKRVYIPGFGKQK